MRILRGIESRSFDPKASDFKDGIVRAINGHAGRINRIARATINLAMIKNHETVIGEVLHESYRRQLIARYNKPFFHQTFLSGARLYETQHAQLTVPVNDLAFEKTKTIGDILFDSDPQKFFARRSHKACGIMTFPQDTLEPLALVWVKLRANIADGVVGANNRRFHHLSSDPRIKLLDVQKRNYAAAVQLALPSPNRSED